MAGSRRLAYVAWCVGWRAENLSRNMAGVRNPFSRHQEGIPDLQKGCLAGLLQHERERSLVQLDESMLLSDDSASCQSCS